MKTCLYVSLFLLLATGAPAQRRGGGGHSGGRVAIGNSGYRGGGGVSLRGGYGGSYGGYRGSYGGYRGSYGGYRGSYGGYSGSYGWGGWGYRSSYGYWPSYYGYGYGYGLGVGYGWSGWDYPGYYDAYPVYSPRVTVVYANPAPAPRTTVYVSNRVAPGVRQYDEWGQEIGAATAPVAAPLAARPIYLIAFRDGVIRAVVSYRVEGSTLRYVLEGKDEHSAPLDSIDRELSLQLNRERRVNFRL